MIFSDQPPNGRKVAMYGFIAYCVVMYAFSGGWTNIGYYLRTKAAVRDAVAVGLSLIFLLGIGFLLNRWYYTRRSSKAHERT